MNPAGAGPVADRFVTPQWSKSMLFKYSVHTFVNLDILFVVPRNPSIERYNHERVQVFYLKLFNTGIRFWARTALAIKRAKC